MTNHATSLTEGEIVEQNDLGSITKVTADSFPILNGMSIKRIVLNPGAMRTPHWHANANELTYCVSGTSLVSMLDSYSKFASFTISSGEMFHIDSGSLHHIEVVDAPDIHFAIFFDQPMPGDIGYRASASAYSREVLAATFNMHIDDLPDFPFTKTDPLSVGRCNPVDRRDSVTPPSR
jgi:oxalate decarboxylase